MQLSDNTPLLTLLGDNISNSNKSVLSAMLFWYSLQYITRFPFRVVGKIKQVRYTVLEMKYTVPPMVNLLTYKRYIIL